MAKYPIFLELTGRRVVVIGGGPVALRKAQALLDAGARLVVVAKQACEAMTLLCAGHSADLIRSEYSREYLGHAALVIAATNDVDLNRRIYQDCRGLEILCNVVDQPDLCDFFVPAVVQRGSLQIAVGTDGYCPAYASHIRKKLEDMFTDQHGQFLAELEGLRKRLIEEVPEGIDRKALLGEFVSDPSFDKFVRAGPEAWRRQVMQIIEARRSPTEADAEPPNSH